MTVCKCSSMRFMHNYREDLDLANLAGNAHTSEPGSRRTLRKLTFLALSVSDTFVPDPCSLCF